MFGLNTDKEIGNSDDFHVSSKKEPRIVWIAFSFNSLFTIHYPVGNVDNYWNRFKRTCERISSGLCTRLAV